MAARGLAPLKPVELLAVLYQLATGTDPAEAPLKAAAEKSIADLPEKILGPALGEPTLDPRILDFFGARLVGRPALLEIVLLNRGIADSTVLALVPRLSEKELEIVSVNELRLLREPAIIAALYLNPRARMSTVDRAIELAVRNKLVVEGIPRWDDLVQAVLGTKTPPKPAAEVDAAFSAIAKVAIGDEKPAAPLTDASGLDDDELETIAAKEDKEIEEAKKEIPIEMLTPAQKIRLATLGNAYARAILVRDPMKVVAVAAINSPGITDNEVIKFSANRSLSDEVIRVIANTKEWLKLYQIKKHLVNNPKCPLPVSMRLLPFLHAKDLKNLARSKGIPSALSTMAKKLVAQKGG